MRPVFAAVFAVSLMSASGGCGPQQGGLTEDEGAKTPEVESVSSKLTINNSLQVNGLNNNGLYVNGLSFNSMVPNGLYVNGLPLNGLPLNGLYVNGLYVNGIGYNGLPVNGLPLNGLYVNGLPVNGLPVNGLPLNGLYVNGLPLNGLYVNGLPVNGLSLNGLPLNGLYVNGLPLNGLYVNGVYPNGLYVNGLPLNGLPLNGLYVNGTNPATAIKIANTVGQVVSLTANEETAFESMMGHLAWCALPQGDALTIYRSSGQAKSYPGYHNLAPTWKTKALVEDPNGIDDSEELRWCVEHYRAVASDDGLYEGLALNAQQQADLEKLLKYAIECALDSGDSVSIQFPSGPKTFYGALGLAPAWKSGALDATGQKAVSACLAARTNALGNTVRISLRNPAYAGLNVSEVERQNFRTHEGAFWGNVFGSSPALHACKAEGGGPSGRLCTDGSCGFTPDPIPSCADAVGEGCDAQDAEGNWTGCGSETETVVLNTFLMTENKLSGSNYHTCLSRADDTVSCWGNGYYGALASGDTTDRLSPTATLGLPAPTTEADIPKELALGQQNTCVRLRGGELWCAGYNLFGQIGDGTTTQRNQFVPVTDLGNQVARVAVGFGFACALKMDGTLWCWGVNDHGELGDGSLTRRYRPVQSGATQLGNQVIQATTASTHMCALKMDGTMWCTGSNNHGELGRGFYSSYDVVPGQAGAAQLADQVVSISIGMNFSCALKEDGTLWCWGRNDLGQLGDGTRWTYPAAPVQAGVNELGDQVLSMSAGYYHACALKTDRSVWCWGSNQSDGSVGDGTTEQVRSVPVMVSLPGPADEIMAAGRSSFAILSDGSVWAWGYNYNGQLGDGSTTNRFAPVRMTALVNSGDGLCEITESSLYEADDCAAEVGGGGSQTEACGDGVCAADETCASCAIDCPGATRYRDADGDGFGTPSETAEVCGEAAGYVADATDCDDGNASIRPGAEEVLDGVDNNCDGEVDENLNLIANPSFANDPTNWAPSTGSLTRVTRKCRTSDGCANFTANSSGSITETMGSTGPGTYTASVWVERVGKTAVTAYLQIEERTAAGTLVGVSNSPSKSLGTSYSNLVVTRTVTAPTNRVKITVFKTQNGTMYVDDVSLTR
ncbi:MAG: hypothetical protein H6729_06465 [Deltaproteobacteria bacterium]|nr:hypothetical protein [Deltaproteobacteria bacterium]